MFKKKVDFFLYVYSFFQDQISDHTVKDMIICQNVGFR